MLNPQPYVGSDENQRRGAVESAHGRLRTIVCVRVAKILSSFVFPLGEYFYKIDLFSRNQVMLILKLLTQILGFQNQTDSGLAQTLKLSCPHACAPHLHDHVCSLPCTGLRQDLKRFQSSITLMQLTYPVYSLPRCNVLPYAKAPQLCLFFYHMHAVLRIVFIRRPVSRTLHTTSS